MDFMITMSIESIIGLVLILLIALILLWKIGKRKYLIRKYKKSGCPKCGGKMYVDGKTDILTDDYREDMKCYGTDKTFGCGWSTAIW